MSGVLRMCRSRDGVFDLHVNEVAKTSNYTILAADNGTLFTNAGASGAVTFTLPARTAGYVFWFKVVADQSMTISSAAGSDMVVGNNASASSVAFTTASQKIGNWVKVYTNQDGTKWYVEQSTSQLVGLSNAEIAVLDGVTAGTGLASKALVLDANGLVTMPDDGMFGMSRAAVGAAGTNQATATAMTDQVNAVTGADGAKGVALPAAATTIGPILVINTDSDAALFVYPVASGNDSINGLSANAGLEMGPGEAAWFIPTSATQWYCKAMDHQRNSENVIATNVLTVQESGKVFFLNAATEFVTTLPAVASSAGVRYTFIVKAAPASASYTIVTDSSENKILGNVLTSQDAGGTSDSEQTGGDTITFVDSKAVVGDRVDLVCDGAFWYATCFCKVFDGITITTAS